MPERKRLLGATMGLFNLSQMLRGCRGNRQAGGQKMAPEAGAISRKY
jgi:hypothetical protein